MFMRLTTTSFLTLSPATWNYEIGESDCDHLTQWIATAQNELRQRLHDQGGVSQRDIDSAIHRIAGEAAAPDCFSDDEDGMQEFIFREDYFMRRPLRHTQAADFHLRVIHPDRRFECTWKRDRLPDMRSQYAALNVLDSVDHILGENCYGALYDTIAQSDFDQIGQLPQFHLFLLYVLEYDKPWTDLSGSVEMEIFKPDDGNVTVRVTDLNHAPTQWELTYGRDTE
jgi:hypothetical protein